MLISVIVPTYNREELIHRCYDSVVRQVHRPLEFILVDDASTDKTESEVKHLKKTEGIYVKYIKLPFNRGVSAARNAAARAAAGDLIAFLDSDDVWFADHLSKLLPLINTASVDVAYTRGDIRESPDAAPSGRTTFGPTLFEESHLRECIYYYNFILPSATIVKREFFTRVGFFDEDPNIQHAEDWDIFIRAAQLGLNFVHLNEPTIYYTVPASTSLVKRQMMLRRGIYCLIKHFDYPFVSESNKYFTQAFYELWLGLVIGSSSREAQEIFWKSLRLPSFFSSISLTSLCGLALPLFPDRGKRYVERILYKSFRSIRAKHRKLRGFKDLFD